MPRSAAAPPPVYPSREDTALLARFAEVGPGRLLLEIGCGQGAASLTAARAGARVVATDVNPAALAQLRRTARDEGLALEVVRTDLAHGVGRFDRVLANPPYLPTPPAARDPDRWVNLALDGGPDGLGPTRRILSTLPDHLRPGGAAYVLFSSRQPAAGRATLLERWTSAGGKAQQVASTALGDEALEVWHLTAPAGGRQRRRSA
jgi:release factor glutamine methyltransferase